MHREMKPKPFISHYAEFILSEDFNEGHYAELVDQKWEKVVKAYKNHEKLVKAAYNHLRYKYQQQRIQSLTEEVLSLRQVNRDLLTEIDTLTTSH